ncbi:GNAT family N-acetyltransferase [Leuconostoc mesenteroides]|uniref:GNAT family N-acetyltransferase n=1 Tax=Leuconostoc mesenteroides TaxID=1245 RepID=UPI00068235A7|nr:GNAT family protein [Leuconostoc mesenteroides]KMY77320.1 acetyltransferase [Leuconostoc mesenteroides subsp. mesenteroides]MBZ1503458.1 GNAT family N-acetyltransferase [Leuconostoc mesenteroides]
MFTFQKFVIDHYKVLLVMPENSHAAELFRIINQDRETLSRWMPWTPNIKTVEDEAQFLNYARLKMAKQKLFMLTILVNNTPVGMIDLHNIDRKNKRAELGYWLSSNYQGLGIISSSVNLVLDYAFEKLNFHKIILRSDSENGKSIAVAHRLNFTLEAILKDQITYNDDFKDLNIFVKFQHK